MTAFDNIKKIAKQRGLSLQEVSKRAGYSPNLIYQYRSQTEPTMETLRNIAKVLGVQTSDLLDEVNDSSSQSDSNKLLETDGTVDGALGTIMSFDGKPVTEHDRQVMKGLLESYLKNKQ